jgi:hypothetical protein
MHLGAGLLGRPVEGFRASAHLLADPFPPMPLSSETKRRLSKMQTAINEE